MDQRFVDGYVKSTPQLLDRGSLVARQARTATTSRSTLKRR